MSSGAERQQAAFRESEELAAAVAEWIRETCHVLRYMQEEVYPATGAVGRDARREIMTIHRRKGLGLLDRLEPETNAADALREAAAWYELREEARRAAGQDVEKWPRWLEWAHRLLPSCGLSRYARMTDETLREVLP